MSRYLEIAEQILRVAKQPLNARQMLGTALQLNLVPPDLYGQTQHKTLQARLSEDILINKDSSRFYRSGRGVFFLREFLDDPKMAAPKEVFARRRRLDLRFKQILSIRGHLTRKITDWISPKTISELAEKELFYQDYAKPVERSTRLWACSVINKDFKYLSYRRGSFRESRDTFLNQRSIGFYGPIVRNDRDLFGQTDEGLMKAVIEITAIDLDMPLDTGWTKESHFHLIGCMVTSTKQAVQDALAVVRISVPSWFEPPRHRLSINDLQWVDIREINDIDAFDPWSKNLIEHLAKIPLARDERKYEKSTAEPNY